MNVMETDLQQRSTQAQRLCRHCGTPVQRSSDLFCCLGCEFVYSSIHSLGLSAFYSLKDRQTVSEAPRAEGIKNYAYLNEPGVKEKITSPAENGGIRVLFYLPTIHCAACVWILEKLPHVVMGIRRSRVSFATGKIEIVIDPSVLTIDQTASLLHSIGYPPVPAIDAAIEEEDRIERRRMLMRIGVSAVCAANTMMLADSIFQGFFTGMDSHFRFLFTWASAIISLPAVTWAAFPFYRAAIASIMTARAHMDLPISIAIVLSYCSDISTIVRGGDRVYFDSITSLIFLLLCARFIQRQSVAKSRATTATSWDLFPSTARVFENGIFVEKRASTLQSGDRIEIRPEERIPCDGTVAAGNSTVNNALLTGESLPVSVSIDARVLGGSLNIDGTLEVRVEKTGAETRLGRVLESLKESQTRIAEIENRANILSGYFTVCVLAIAAISFLYWYTNSSDRALPVTVALLVVTCPCALGLAIPVATAAAFHQARTRGFYIRSAEALHALARATTFVFDKTGTLTTGELTVTDWIGEASDLPSVKALALSGSRHHVSRALEEFCAIAERTRVESAVHRPGLGVSGEEAGEFVSIGSYRWAEERGVFFSEEISKRIHEWMGKGLMISVFERSSRCRAAFALTDAVRPEASDIVKTLGVSGRITIASGDSTLIVRTVADKIGISPEFAFGDLDPEKKADLVRALPGQTAFVGDGMNDAMSLRAAAVGIALSGGIEAALEASDIYVSMDGIMGFEELYRGARKLKSTITRNLAISVCYNIAAAFLAITDRVTPLTAAVLMPMSSFAVILSSAMPRYFEKRRWK